MSKVTNKLKARGTNAREQAKEARFRQAYASWCAADLSRCGACGAEISTYAFWDFEKTLWVGACCLKPIP